MVRPAKQSSGQSIAHHASENAARLADAIFAQILGRAADAGGRDYVRYCLEHGVKSVQQIILDLIVSDEFVDGFASGADAGETANRINTMLLGKALDEPARRNAVRRYLRLGLHGYAEEIILSDAYQHQTGPDKVPPRG